MENPKYPYPVKCPRAGDNFKVSVPSNAGYLIMARAFLAELLKRMSVDEKTTNRLLVAQDEALTNVIRHGYKNDPNKQIDISYCVMPEGLGISIEDECGEFLPEKPIPVKKNPDTPGGLGINLILSIMDDMRYENRETGGTRLVMTKKLRYGSQQGDQT